MEYRVEELAAAGGVTVDTVRFYQGRGLVPPPERRGRVAIYGDAHLAQLRRIRSLLQGGFRLAQIRRLLDREATEASRPSARGLAPPYAPKPGDSRVSSNDPLLAALVAERVGDETYTRSELAAKSGLAEPLLIAAQSAGLFEPIIVSGEERFTDADLEMCRAALGLLSAGFPLDVLLGLAVEHARNVQQVADRSIDLFDDHVRKVSSPDEHAISQAFHSLLPAVTRLVALHFQRTVVNRAMERLRSSGDSQALEEALAATESSRLEVAWR